MSNTVLVVEDADDYRLFMCVSLGREGFRCLEASNGLEALAVLEAHPEVSLVLTDIHMPCRDGLWLLDRAKDMGRAVAVVLMSADATPGETERCGRRHDGFFRKPVDVPALTSTLRDYAAARS